MWSSFWTEIDRFLTSSMPEDGWIHDAKYWIMNNVTERILELAWTCGIRSYKPMSMYTTEDIL